MKRIIALILVLILSVNFIIPVQAEEFIKEEVEENFATQHYNYLMGLINQLIELLNHFFILTNPIENPLV